MIVMALWIISSKNVKNRASNSSRSAIIKKASRACLEMNFYHCGTSKAFSHTRRRVLELVVLINARIPK